MAPGITARVVVQAKEPGAKYKWSETNAQGGPLLDTSNNPLVEVSFQDDTAAITTLTYASNTLPGKKYVKVEITGANGAVKEEIKEIDFITGGRILKITLTDHVDPQKGDSVTVEVRDASTGNLTTKQLDIEVQGSLLDNSKVLKDNPIKFSVGAAGSNEATFGQFVVAPGPGASVEWSDFMLINFKASETTTGGVKQHFQQAKTLANPSTGQPANSGNSTVLFLKIDP